MKTQKYLEKMQWAIMYTIEAHNLHMPQEFYETMINAAKKLYEVENILKQPDAHLEYTGKKLQKIQKVIQHALTWRAAAPPEVTQKLIEINHYLHLTKRALDQEKK